MSLSVLAISEVTCFARGRTFILLQTWILSFFNLYIYIYIYIYNTIVPKLPHYRTHMYRVIRDMSHLWTDRIGQTTRTVVHVYMCVFMCVGVRMCGSVCLCVCVCVLLCVYMCVGVCMWVCVLVCVVVCVCFGVFMCGWLCAFVRASHTIINITYRCNGDCRVGRQSNRWTKTFV